MKVCSWAMCLTNRMIERCKEAEYDATALTVETIDDVILHLRTWREEEVSDYAGRYGFRSVGSTTVFFHRNRTG